jgi:hypothetical protein
VFEIREEGASKLEAMKSDYENKARTLVSALIITSTYVFSLILRQKNLCFDFVAGRGMWQR